MNVNLTFVPTVTRGRNSEFPYFIKVETVVTGKQIAPLSENFEIGADNSHFMQYNNVQYPPRLEP